jgi:hypothetical protein
MFEAFFSRRASRVPPCTGFRPGVHRIPAQGIVDYETRIGHPTLLSRNEEDQVIERLRRAFDGRNLLSPKQLREYVWETFKKWTSRGGVWHFVRHNSEDLEHAKAYPQESGRMTIAKEIARTHVANLVNDVQDILTELVFNLDEVGSQEWADRKPRKIIIPHRARPQMI